MRVIVKRVQTFKLDEVEQALFDWLDKRDVPKPSSEAIECKMELSNFGITLSWTEDITR